MKTEFQCENCGAGDWDTLGKATYRKADAERHGEYVKKRLKVLFEVWFPGKDEVELSSLACENCGFVCYSPRPDETDIDAKYLALSELGQDYGKEEASENAKKRAARMFRKLSRWLPNSAGDVLDFGGGDGRLMADFSAAGHRCYLVDYNEEPSDLVQKIGNTLDSVAEDQRFDFIVANHVIEHVAEPKSVVSSLAGLLREGGRIFVEVPMEICGEAPLHSEPVTHVNFFVEGSMRRLIEESGLIPLESRLTTYLHPSGRLLPVIQVVAEKRDGQSVSDSNKSSGRREVAAWLSPTLFDKVKREWCLRENFPAKLAYWLRSKLRLRSA